MTQIYSITTQSLLPAKEPVHAPVHVIRYCLFLLVLCSLLFSNLGAAPAQAQAACISLMAPGAAYSETFNTLSNTAGSTANNLTIEGWYLAESGGSGRDNEQYAVDTGGSSTGDTYSYGSPGSTERALGGLRTSTLMSSFGACFTNTTGFTITSLDIAYTGEEWRLGTAARTDRILFENSIDATSLVTGIWTAVPTLNFVTPNTVTTGVKNGNAVENRTALSSPITDLSIPNGSTFWIRWTDTDATSSDDGLAIDDFSLTPRAAAQVTFAGLEQTYDGTPKSVTATTDPAGLAVTITYDDSPAPPTNAGGYMVVATVNDPSYQGTASNTLTIGKAPLTVTANDATKEVGAPLPVFTASYAGFVPGQDSSVLDGTLSFITSATEASPAGIYPVTPGGLTSTNYAITFVDGTLTVIDTVAPDTAIDSQPANPSNSADASFMFSGTDAVRFECSLDGGIFVTCTTPQSYSSLNDGIHIFQVRAVDRSGNVDPTPASYTWVTDAAAPDTTLTSHPTNPTSSTYASFAFTGSDTDGTGITGFQCDLDGDGFAACITPQNYSDLSEGDHTFQVRAMDAAGNVDPTPASYTWIVDTRAPTVAITSAASDPTRTSPIPVTVQFSESVTDFLAADVTVTNGTIDNFAGTGDAYTFDLTPSGQGLVTVDLAAGVAIDAVGNGNLAAPPFSRAYDTISPTVTSINRAAGQANPTSASSVEFTVMFSESVSNVGADDFSLNTTGDLIGAFIEAVTGSGSTRTVRVNTGSGNGTIRLDVPITATITDVALNPLEDLPFPGDELFTIEKGIGKDTYDDLDSSWVYNGVWTAHKGKGPIDNTSHYTRTVGDSAEFTFTGTRFILTYARHPNYGSIDIFVDGTKIDTIDTYSSTLIWRVIWPSPYFTAGTHTVRFEHAGPAGTYIDLDAIQILDTPPPTPVGVGVYDDTDNNWYYSSGWTAYNGIGPSNNTSHYTSTVGGFTELTFTGTRFTLTYARYSSYGLIDVFVDDDYVGTINTHHPIMVWQATWNSPTFGFGTHLVRLVHAGPRGKHIDIDAIEIRAGFPGAGTYDEADGTWSYSNDWRAYTRSGPKHNTGHYTGTIGESAEFTFTGTRFLLSYALYSNYGSIDVFVDGASVGTINTYSPTMVWRAVWASPSFAAGTHTVRLVHAGPAGTYIDIDAIQILDTSPPLPVGAGASDDANSNWFYSDGWTTYNGSGPTNNSSHYTGTPTHFAELTFTGTRFTLTYTKYSNYGLIEVYVDGVKVGTIDSYSPTLVWRATWSSPTFAPGDHTLRLVHAGDGAYIEIDAITIMP